LLRSAADAQAPALRHEVGVANHELTSSGVHEQRVLERGGADQHLVDEHLRARLVGFDRQPSHALLEPFHLLLHGFTPGRGDLVAALLEILLIRLVSGGEIVHRQPYLRDVVEQLVAGTQLRG
jgi:hypothetical protein